ncbi:UDP-N-acetylmuramoyl-L-alanine--D-glutamate ligase [Verrucosispora sp. WMMA2044]|uniref:UDP-N-acetylmuramoyl-L-alanine--D-glutamate ligase n=1 Tax=Verrucosispora sp. WMMA2044 TaxID=3016419 RepID=UPI00248B82F0|nr:UDP-N-acetylmuramoyl-L-alanine--D-glutamate ligase [Verrucosispora sp. WMMA2044]WBB50152.1 UDP-N-acetylmuramoyl-L-alanine--D-glutamate ligase [Verrucosispora sp. WMMA2044]
MHLSDLRGRSVAIWGTGREGMAAAIAVAAHGPAALVAVDDREDFLSLPWVGAVAEAAPLVSGKAGLERLLAADVVVRSPGVPQTHPWMPQLRERGVLITQGTALWMADHAERTIGVTGSKGKSTTSSLISHLLTAVDRSNVFGGNIGVPTLELPEAELYVLELSSYQCSDLTESPRVAVVTALFPEHLDAHGSEQQYYRDKLNLIAYGPRTVVVNGSDPRLDVELGDRAAVRAGTGDSVNVAVGPDGEPWFHLVDQPLFPRAVLSLVGRHNEGNLCVALAVLGAIGVDVVARKDTLAIAVAEFQGLAHRLTEIADPSGITFVDDTLATSPYAAMYAIDAYDGRPLTVILGGNDRGVDYGPLRDHLAEREITVIGIPDSGPRIVATLADLPGVNSEIAEGLTAAVRQARKLTPPGGVVLLSPAAPSYGRYRNYQHRSEAFREAIKETAGSAS